ncbi:endospore germination permease [Peribacillus muralis]|uniref:GerAB/ArcD/ProY family transporter n=1 Tax=Peribacillus muralis TaxID=264697 RepID=UPI001F4E2D12|nr:endospore germination permease [Peribacillus muralis]MCK1991227.1 endospore germination permease [Peribacillus muralis]MCK2011781.1 endospore germination permease [Peribacillus muralis]
MLEKGRISSGDFLILVIIFTIGGAILTLPSSLVTYAKQDGWIAYIIATVIGLCFIFLYNQLASLYPSMNYIEVNEKIFGRVIGKISALLFLFYIYYLSSALLSEIGNFFTTQVLLDTPIQVIMILFLLTSLFGVRLGLEVICRTALIFFPWIIVLLFILFLFLIPDIKIENLQPMLEEGMKPILKGSYHSIAHPYIQLIFFLMITPYVNEKAEMKKNFYRGTILGGIVLFLVIMFSILVLGVDNTTRLTYPSYKLGMRISVGNFIERVEVIVAFIWIFTEYFKLTICYYGLALGLAQLLGLKDYKILLFPLAFLILTFAIYSHPDIIHYQNFVATTWTPFSLTIGVLLPLLLLVVGKIRKKLSASKR